MKTLNDLHEIMTPQEWIEKRCFDEDLKHFIALERIYLNHFDIIFSYV